MKSAVRREAEEEDEGKIGGDADDGDEEFEVEQLEAMMLKMSAVRGTYRLFLLNGEDKHG